MFPIWKFPKGKPAASTSYSLQFLSLFLPSSDSPMAPKNNGNAIDVSDDDDDDVTPMDAVQQLVVEKPHCK